MNLRIIKPTLSVCKVPDYSGVNWADKYLFIGKTDEENHSYAQLRVFPITFWNATTAGEPSGYREFLDFSLIGILLEDFDDTCGERNRIFAVSTYNTDYILRRNKLFESRRVMKEHGYIVEE
jgi:hypothetical protein